MNEVKQGWKWEATQITVIEQVEDQITNFSPQQLAQFRLWFAQYDSDAWDVQIESDAASGKLEDLASEALVEYSNGKAQEI